MTPGILVSSPDMDPPKREKRREKVTKHHWKDSKQASVPFTAAEHLIQGKHLP